jgi:tricorn protease-like protein
MAAKLRMVFAAIALPTLCSAGAAVGVPLEASRSAAIGSSSLIVYNHVNDLYTVSADGTTNRQLTRGQFVDQSPAWSPDHRWIAFARQSHTGPIHIFRMRPDGSHVEQVTTGHSDDVQPTWSPDGRRIAFSRVGSTVTIEIVRTDGGGLHKVMRGVAPAWSPDGRWLAVDRIDKGGKAAVFLVHPDGQSLRRLTPLTLATSYPDWSPDGGTLALVVFNQVQGNAADWNADVAVINRDGSDLRRVTSHHVGMDTRPTWSPDGRQLVFSRSTYDATGQTVSDMLFTVKVVAGPTADVLTTGLVPTPVRGVTGTQPDW